MGPYETQELEMFDQNVAEKLVEQQERLTSEAAWYHRNKEEIQAVAEIFAGAGITVNRANLGGQCVDLAIAGDSEILKRVFTIFRNRGYAPSNRPDENDKTGFSCFFNHPDFECRFWLNFSSTVCHRVQVGTKMVEQPVYKVVCE
jgi:hypothetical protein